MNEYQLNRTIAGECVILPEVFYPNEDLQLHHAEFHRRFIQVYFILVQIDFQIFQIRFNAHRRYFHEPLRRLGLSAGR